MENTPEYHSKLKRHLIHGLDLRDPERGDFLQIVSDNLDSEIKTILEKNGYIVIEANEAQDLLKEEIFQLYLKAQMITEQYKSEGKMHHNLPHKVAILMTHSARDEACDLILEIDKAKIMLQ